MAVKVNHVELLYLADCNIVVFHTSHFAFYKIGSGTEIVETRQQEVSFGLTIVCVLVKLVEFEGLSK